MRVVNRDWDGQVEAVLSSVRRLVRGSVSPRQRAALAEELVRAVYDHVKETSPLPLPGEEVDVMPERVAMARVVASAVDHHNKAIDHEIQRHERALRGQAAH